MARDGNLRLLLREYLPEGDWVSVETGATAGGVPDSNYCFPGGKEGWVEAKVTSGWKVTLRPSQVGWLDRRSRRGGRCFVFARRISGSADELHVIPGRDAVRFSQEAKCSLLGYPTFFRTIGGARHWDWKRLREILTE